MNVVIYARYSDPRQHESSIEVQIEQAEALAKEKGYSVVDYYIDRGITATDDKRPELQRLMRDSKKGLFSAVIVYKSDRFFRDNEKYYIYKHELSKNNVALLAVKERYEDSATGRFQESVVVALNQLFSEQSAERVTDGMRKTAEKGLFVGGAVPTGFKIERQEYVIDPNTAPIIKMIFEKYADGMNMKDIIDELNERGLKTSRGRPFTKNAFNGIIDNKRYTGCYIYKDIEIPDRIPRIISDEIWERVHLRRKRVRGTKGTRYNYLLTGKLYCGVCENLMYGYTGTSHTSEKYHYYKCSDRICKREWKYIPQQPLEDFVINHCRDILTDEHIAEIAHQNVTMSERESERPFYKQLKKNLKTAEKELEELGNVLSKGQEIDYILSLIGKKREEIERIKSQLIEEEYKNVTITIPEITFFLRHLRNGDVNDEKYRRMLVDVMVNKVYVYDDRCTVILTVGDSFKEFTIRDLESLGKKSPKKKIPRSKQGEALIQGSYKRINGVP